MTKKHHAKHKKSHREDTEAGYLSISLKDLMNKNDKIIIAIIIIGILVLLVLSSLLIVNNKSSETNEALISPTPVKRITTPYPTIPSEIKDTTVMVNRRTILPNSVTIKKGGTVGFYNEDQIVINIKGYDSASEILNIGPIVPNDIPVVKFDEAGTYRYVNPQNPQDVAEIVVSE